MPGNFCFTSLCTEFLNFHLEGRSQVSGFQRDSESYPIPGKWRTASPCAFIFFLHFIYLFSYLLLAVLALHCCKGFSVVVAGGGYSLDTIYWTSHCCGFSCCRAQALEPLGFSSCGTWLSCPTARGIFLDQGSNPCTLLWQADSLPLSHQGRPPFISQREWNKYFENFHLLIIFLIGLFTIRK